MDSIGNQPDEQTGVSRPIWGRPAFQLLILVLCIVISGAVLIGVPYQRRMTLVRRIENRGGTARLNIRAPEFLSTLVGDEYLFWFTRIIFIDLSDTEANDDDLRELRSLHELEFLNLLGKTRVTDAGVESLQQALPKLTIQRSGGAFFGVSGWTTGGSGSHTIPGVTISRVMPDSGAARGGILEGDILRKIDGQIVRSFEDLIRNIVQRTPGDQIHVELERDGRPLEFDITLAAWK